MREVYVTGVGMTRFAKFLDRSVKDLTREAMENVLADANLSMEGLQAAWFSNSNWGNYSGQHSIRGQVALRPLGIMGLPITNVENAEGCDLDISFPLSQYRAAKGTEGAQFAFPFSKAGERWIFREKLRIACRLAESRKKGKYGRR
jgi:hypothetical protein